MFSIGSQTPVQERALAAGCQASSEGSNRACRKVGCTTATEICIAASEAEAHTEEPGKQWRLLKAIHTMEEVRTWVSFAPLPSSIPPGNTRCSTCEQYSIDEPGRKDYREACLLKSNVP
jgi:hypothetical protein